MKLKRIATMMVGSSLLFVAGIAQAHNHDSSNNQADSGNRNIATRPMSASDASAYNDSDDSSTLRNIISNIKFNGFLSAGFAKTGSEKNYAIPDHGTVNNKYSFAPLSLAGLQAQAKIDKDLSAVIQLVMNGDDTNGNSAYQIKAEWAYLRYQAMKNLNVYAGRFRIPLFLYSNTLEVGYNYVWTFLPNEVYRIVPFYNMNGVEVSYNMPLGNSDWNVMVEPFIGQNKSKYDYYLPDSVQSQIPSLKLTTNFDENNLLGGVVAISNPYVTLRASYGRTSLTASNEVFDVVDVREFKDKTVSFYTFGGKVDYHNIVAAAEYAHRSSTNNNAIAELTGYYGMLGYQYKKFLPNITFAKLKTNNATALKQDPLTENQVEDQKSITVGLDYYVNSHVVVKGSLSRIEPQNGSAGLFDYAPEGSVNMYTFAVNATF